MKVALTLVLTLFLISQVYALDVHKTDYKTIALNKVFSMKTISFGGDEPYLSECRKQMDKKIKRNLRLWAEQKEEKRLAREEEDIDYVPDNCDDKYYNYHYRRHYCKLHLRR